MSSVKKNGVHVPVQHFLPEIFLPYPSPKSTNQHCIRMFGSKVLGIAIGLILIYLLLSMFITILNEIISTMFKLRARELWLSIDNMLHDNALSGLADKFYKHPMIESFSNKILKFKHKRRKPSYISSDTFVKVLLDTLRTLDGKELANAEPITAASIHGLIEEMPAGRAKTMLSTLWADAENDIEKFKEGVENWYNKTMERVSGWYKRRMKALTFILSLGISIGFNASTFNIVATLATENESRSQIFALAQSAVNELEGNSIVTKPTVVVVGNDSNAQIQPAVPEITQEQHLQHLDTLKTQMDTVLLRLDEVETLSGIGWGVKSNTCDCKEDGFWKCVGILLLGWIITAVALTLGAPFWFDILKKAVNMRGTGTPE